MVKVPEHLADAFDVHYFVVFEGHLYHVFSLFKVSENLPCLLSIDDAVFSHVTQSAYINDQTNVVTYGNFCLLSYLIIMIYLF